MPLGVEKLREDFRRMLQEVEAETDRDGTVSVEDVLQEMDKAIEEAHKTRASLRNS